MRRSIDFLAEDRVRLERNVAREELREDLKRAAYLEGRFELESGVVQDYYFDKYLFVTQPSLLRRVGRFMAELVPQGSARLVTSGLGTVVLGTAVSLQAGIPMVVVREEGEEGSLDQQDGLVFGSSMGMTGVWPGARGEVYTGEGVTVVEDVVVTGTRASRTVKAARDAGVQVDVVASVIDCGRGGEKKFEELSVSYRYLFGTAELGL